jgi:transposase, IS5 family
MMNQPGFFDVDRRLEAISAKGDPLDTINEAVPWETFRADRRRDRHQARGEKEQRPPARL